VFCSSLNVVKNGHKAGKQLYKCKDCGRQFVGGKRINLSDVEHDYIEGKQTLAQLSIKYGICIKTVWNMLGSMRHKRVISKDKDVIVEMDAIYWGRYFGIVVIKDAFRNKVLWYKFIRGHERVDDYVEGVDWLKSHGFKIWGIVCDGLKGLFEAFRQIPVQMCQFHMISIVRRYLTKNPDVEAARELLALVKTLAMKNQATFMEELGQWHSRHEEILKEKRIDDFGKKHFTCPRLRSAYLSIKHHAPWLWTFEKFGDLPLRQSCSLFQCVIGLLFAGCSSAESVSSSANSQRYTLSIKNHPTIFTNRPHLTPSVSKVMEDVDNSCQWVTNIYKLGEKFPRTI